MYEFFCDIKQLNFPEPFHQLYIDLENQLKEDCAKLNELDKMNILNNAHYFRQDVADLLESHNKGGERTYSLTLKDIEQRLKSMEEKDQYCIYSR